MNGLRVRAPGDVIAFAITLVILLVLYLPLQNPYWAQGGDSEVYITAARNLATGNGYMFNGLPVSISPPGWSIVMAGLMLISPTFLLLKLAAMSCMIGSLAITYWICRRFVSPIVSVMVVSLTALISHVYSLTFWLHSDALFCFVSSWAILTAMQIREGRDSIARAILLLLLCCASVSVRWVGLGTWLLSGAILVQGGFLPLVNRHRVIAFCTGLATLLAFIGIRWALTVPPDVQRQIRNLGGAESASLTERVDSRVAVSYPIFNTDSRGIAGIIARAGGWGNWISYLLWQPMRMGSSGMAMGAVSLLCGTLVLIPLWIMGWKGLFQGQLLWPAMLFYSFGLALNWTGPNARYLVPIAPFIILGVFLGIRALRTRFGRPVIWNTMLGYFVASLVICNGGLWAVDVAVARSDDYYANYEAGLNRDLIAASKWLIDNNAQDGEIAVSTRYVNLGNVRTSWVALRAPAMLTGKAIGVVDKTYVVNGDPYRSARFLSWARKKNYKYVIYMPEVSPWRLFHFRVPWLQEAMTGEPAVDTGAGWRLYKIPPEGEGDEAKRISLTTTPNWPTRVPGM